MAGLRRVSVVVAIPPFPKPPLPSDLTPPSYIEGAVAVKERENDGVEVPSSLSSVTGELASPSSMAEPTELPLLPFLQSPLELHPCQAFGHRNAAVTESRLLPLLHVTSRAASLFPRSFGKGFLVHTSNSFSLRCVIVIAWSSITVAAMFPATTAADYGLDDIGSSDCIRVSSVGLTIVATKVRRVGVVVGDCCELGAYCAMELTVYEMVFRKNFRFKEKGSFSEGIDSCLGRINSHDSELNENVILGPQSRFSHCPNRFRVSQRARVLF
ncbi:hypothetical protein PIB30_090603 [Stylosanthes scabra]|uniref:Uncharacterized protein n=1 Tax=Stylosanthes scabra TaxID=79078 RepID=A0ABU6TWN7_9FABA|nr:hypothetical protein [Stylosanthes scabra]